MMNDPSVMESSHVLASSLSQQKLGQDQLLTLAFRKIICRKPNKKELEILQRYFEKELNAFDVNPKKADKLLGIGEYKKEAKSAKSFTAALMQTIQLIYNMEEALIRV
jgi:hypothetical protein